MFLVPWIVALLLVLLLLAVKALRPRKITVYEFQKALLYRRGRYSETLGPGQYWLLNSLSSITLVDVRPEFISVQGQDVLSADGVSLKVSLAAEFQVDDPNIAVNKNANYRTSLY